MIHDPIVGLAAVIAIGVSCQLLAQRLRVPSIIVLLGAGLTVGPLLGWIKPDLLYGDLLFPSVSAAVGILLFEGGLGLRGRDLTGVRVVVVRLLTFGVVVSGAVGALAAWTVGGLSPGPAVLFGVIMVVTGPTVVIPLLRQARLRPDVGRVLRWEGICVDPIGAVLAVVVLEVLLDDEGFREAVRAVATTAAIGSVVGLAAGAFVVWVLQHDHVPDHLENAFVFASVLATLAVADELVHEAGLVATTVLGIVLGNQRRVRVRGIAEFHESIAVLLVPLMFVLLAARVGGAELIRNLLPAVGVLIVLVFVSRPLSVYTSTIGSNLSASARRYIAAMAPRGIVAASVSALFGLRLEQENVPGGEDLAALTFLVVAGTVVIYGLAAIPLAKRLHVAVPEPTGIVLVGAPAWAVALGEILADQGVPVLVVACDDDDDANVMSHGLLVYSGRLQGDELNEAVELVGARLALVVSPREEGAAFAADRLGRLLGQSNVYVVPVDAADLEARSSRPSEHWGRLAFGGHLTLEDAREQFSDGYSLYPVDREVAEEEQALVQLSAEGVPTVVDGTVVAAKGTVVVLGRTRPSAPSSARRRRRRDRLARTVARPWVNR